MMTQSEHEEMGGEMQSTLSQLREALQSGDTEGALQLLDQYESEMNEEESGEEQGLEPKSEEGSEMMPSKPAIKNEMPESVKRFAGMTR